MSKMFSNSSWLHPTRIDAGYASRSSVLVVAVVCFLLSATLSTAQNSAASSQCISVEQYGLLGSSRSLQPGVQKYDDRTCQIGSVGVRVPQASDAITFGDISPACKSCFQEALESIEEQYERLDGVRCEYMKGIRLRQAAILVPGTREAFEREVGRPAREWMPRILADLGSSLRELDRCFESHVGLSGWYSSYGNDILQDAEELYIEETLE